MLLAGIIQNSAVAVIFVLPFIAATAGFLKYNKYPARVFPGDVGTLTTGAMIGGVMILGSIEVATFCALLAHIFNSFYVIISERGLRESHTIKVKDIRVLEDNRIQASVQEGAPVTLPRLLLAFGEMNEPQLVNHFWRLSGMAGVLGVVAAVATAWTMNASVVGQGALLGLYLGILAACAVVFAILFQKNRRLRGIAIIMILLLGVGLGLLLAYDQFIMPLAIANPPPWKYFFEFGVLGIIALPAFILWYFIQNRYFWRCIDRYKATFS